MKLVPLRDIPIRVKVVSLVTLLLTLMTVAAVFSYLESQQTVEVRNEMQDLTSFLLPIVGALENIGIHSLEQQLHLERVTHLLLDGKAGTRDGVIEQELADFERWGKRIRDEIALADRQIEEALKQLNHEEGRLLISRVDPQLELFGSQHGSFEEYSRNTFAAARSQQAAELDSQQAILEVEQKRLNEMLDNLRRDIEGFQERTANRVSRADAQLSARSSFIVGLAFSALLLGGGLALLVTRRLVNPIQELKAATEKIAGGDLNVQLQVRSMDEIGHLSSSFNKMVGGLRERKRIQDTFGHYVDPRVVQHLLQAPANSPPAERRVMTSFFSDIKGFTAIAERLTPESLVRLINGYLTDFSQPISGEKGVIDKFIGDSIMAYWGPPFVPEQEQATLACRAALLSLQELEKFPARISQLTGLQKDAPKFDIRIGIATGSVVVGSIGSASSKNFTVMGDTVNLASRLEGACKTYRVRCLVSEETRGRVDGSILFREIDCITVVGKSEPIRIFEPKALGKWDSPLEDLCSRFEGGLAAYRSRNWEQALRSFQSCLEIAPDDGPARVFLERTRSLAESPPAADWKGVWMLASK